MRIAIAKPDWGIVGGFELVLGEVSRRLATAGHEVQLLALPARRASHRPFGVKVSDEIWEAAPEYFDHVAMIDGFSGLQARQADLLISTQPPSYAVSHPHHLSIFFHHARQFYDLSELTLAARLTDQRLQQTATQLVRALDRPLLDAVSWFLAGSEDVAARLSCFNGIDRNVSILHAGLGFTDRFPDASESSDGSVLCVSRHEFPKRTELFVHAMHLTPGMDAVAVGGGGRLGWVQRLDDRFATGPDELDDDERLWLTNPGWIPADGRADRRVRYLVDVAADELHRLYRNAACVVAPAYGEDYGLTAIEAMAFGKPVVVCRDGGNLARLVKDKVNGLVVEPTGAAIAEAVGRLAAERDWASSLGAAGRELAAEFTWDRAMAEVDDAIERALSR
jgi:glycosyltransferase involved in cell wall biosynthesis